MNHLNELQSGIHEDMLGRDRGSFIEHFTNPRPHWASVPVVVCCDVTASLFR